MSTRRFVLFLMLAALCIAGAGQASAFYNPGTGRWLSKDPLGELAFNRIDKTSIRRLTGRRIADKIDSDYVFIKNNPISNIDFLGFEDFYVMGTQIAA